MDTIFDDGGRHAAGYRGEAGDCVVRAIAIATQQDYKTVYKSVSQACKCDGHSSARDGVRKQTYKRYLTSIGWEWTPTMQIGSGCKVHLRAEELPMGRLIVSVSRHLVAVIDRVIHDTYNPSRNGTRCVYGYWKKG